MMRPAMHAALGLSLLASAASGQSLRDRIDRVRDGDVLLRFTGRPGICGDGAHFIRVSRGSYMGNYMDGASEARCAPGPVQVRIHKVDGAVDRLDAWVGPVRQREGVDLGQVPAPAAASYLLELAATAEGGATRAILPAVLADSAVVWPGLLEIARDTRTRSRSTRQDAAFWLSRFAASALAGRPNQLLDSEGDDDATDLRRHAVFVLSQLPHGEAVPALLDAARTARDLPVRTAALFWLGQSGDTRALDLFEALLAK